MKSCLASSWDTVKLIKDGKILTEKLKKRQTVGCEENVKQISC